MRIGMFMVATGSLAGLSVVGCVSNTDSPAVAVAAATATVAAAGINRAATKDCWARCSNGYVCNRESGLCEPGECRPACSPGFACTVTATGMGCEPEGGMGFAVEPARKPSDLAVNAPHEADRSNPSSVAAPAGRPRVRGKAMNEYEGPQGPRKNGLRDEARRELGVAIFDDLDSLRAEWTDREAYTPVASVPQKQERIQKEYMTQAYRHLHPVYVQGFLERVKTLSQTHALNNPKLVTKLELVIDGTTGKLLNLGLVSSSGNELFDVATLESAKRAAPYPEVREEMRAADGTAILHCELHQTSDYTCSTYISAAPLTSE